MYDDYSDIQRKQAAERAQLKRRHGLQRDADEALGIALGTMRNKGVQISPEAAHAFLTGQGVDDFIRVKSTAPVAMQLPGDQLRGGRSVYENAFERSETTERVIRRGEMQPSDEQTGALAADRADALSVRGHARAASATRPGDPIGAGAMTAEEAHELRPLPMTEEQKLDLVSHRFRGLLDEVEAPQHLVDTAEEMLRTRPREALDYVVAEFAVGAGPRGRRIATHSLREWTLEDEQQKPGVRAVTLGELAEVAEERARVALRTGEEHAQFVRNPLGRTGIESA